MNSFFTLVQQVFFGAVGATTLLVPNSNLNNVTAATSSVHVALTEKATTTVDFNTRMHGLRKHAASLYMAGREFQIILADTNELRIKGLSDSAPIASDRAMLFSFDKPSRYGFWMKDMHYSIDMIWVDINGKVVHIVSGAAPESFPKIFKPSADAIAVIEVENGTVKKIGLTEGQYIGFKGIK